MKGKSYICPRCGMSKIIDLGETIECTVCKLEFDKEDIESYEKDQILSIEEKIAFVKGIRINNKSKNDKTDERG